ncbi:MAG TPA: hypothetical protein DDW50_08805 [Firmicutes bacterium]|jgi:hypothetical protein|nr:hypothetical protein [Bacillota bacterium]
MKKIYLVLILCLGLFITGCSSTRLTSYIDPDFKNVTYNKLMIFADTNNIESRTKFERIIVSQFADKSINAVSSLDIFPPTREIDSKEIPNILAQNGIDGTLRFRETNFKTGSTYIPGQTYSNTYGNIIGNSVYTNTSSYTTPGYNINNVNATYEVKIIDAKTEKTAWIATANTNGESVSGLEELARSFGNGLIEKLQVDNMIPTYKK